MATFTVPAPQLRLALQTAQAFMYDDFTLPALNGVHMAPDGDLVAFTATNRFIASHETLKAEGEAFETVIPGRVVAALISMLAPVDVEGYDEDGPVPPVEPFDLATFVQADDGKTTVRLVGPDTVEIAFEPPSRVKFPNLAKIFEQAEADTGKPLAGVYFAPAQLAAVLDAIKARDDRWSGIDPLEIVAAAKGQPMVVRQGESFKALIMSVKVSDG